MERFNYSSGAKWEDVVGYSRAVKIGNTIEVTGTVAVNDNGEIVGTGNPYEQTKFIIEKIGKVLQRAGASLSDVVRTRMFVTDISRWDYQFVEYAFCFDVSGFLKFFQITETCLPYCV